MFFKNPATFIENNIELPHSGANGPPVGRGGAMGGTWKNGQP